MAHRLVSKRSRHEVLQDAGSSSRYFMPNDWPARKTTLRNAANECQIANFIYTRPLRRHRRRSLPPRAAEAGMPARVVAKKHSCGCVARYESRRRRPYLTLFYGPRAMGRGPNRRWTSVCAAGIQIFPVSDRPGLSRSRECRKEPSINS